MDSKENAHIVYLLSKYNFKTRFESLLIQMQDLLDALGILDKVTINTDLLGQAVLNYFEDIDRLKSFGGIDRTNEDKIYGYEAFWLLRDKPIQFLSNDIPYEHLYINERVVTLILIAKVLKEANIHPDSGNDRLLPFIKLVYYNFKYRVYTPQSIELMITAFFCACRFNHSN
ncbi:MAG: hypothetical protein IKI64_05440 [Clostridia bacterium]|nr:hypothetical protein [Clostridia bacterium]